MRRSGIIWLAGGTLLMVFIALAGCGSDEGGTWYITGCRFDPAAPQPWLPVIPDVTVEQLRDAPSEIELASHRLVLDAALNRDFFPPVNPAQTRMTGRFSVQDADSLAIKSEVSCDFAWVIQGDRKWVVVVEESWWVQYCPEYTYIVDARGGPKWETGTLADVIVRVRFGSEAEGLLAARGVLITESS